MSRTTESMRGVEQGGAATGAQGFDFDAEHRPDVARRVSVAGLHREAAKIQQKAAGNAATEGVHAAAARGVASPTTALPHAAQIQASFGPRHDVSQIAAHVGGDAASAMGATAFASGNHVVFDRAPDLHTAAHEAAHVVQQARGVNLYGGVGEAGDGYERHADAVADRVVAGESAADLLGASSASAAPAQAVQRKEVSDASPAEQHKQHDKADLASLHALQASLDLGATQLKAAADEISRLITSPVSEAGAAPQLDSIRRRIKQTTADFHVLNTHVGRLTVAGDPMTNRGMPSDGGQLRHEVGRIMTAFGQLEMTVTSAEHFANQHGDKLGADLSFAKDDLKDMVENKFSTEVEKPQPHALSSDNADILRTEAIGLNLSAAFEAARAVRMELTAAPEPTVTSDLIKVKRHIGEIAALLKQHSDPKAMKTYRTRVQQIVDEVQALEAALAGKPSLEVMLKDGNFVPDMHNIHDKMRDVK